MDKLMIGLRNIKVVGLKSLFKITLLVFLTLFFFSCTYQSMVDNLIPDDVEKFTEDYIETVRSGDIETALSLVGPEDPGAAVDQYRESLKEVSFYLSIGLPVSTELVMAKQSKFSPFGDKTEVPHSRYFQDFYTQYSPDDRPVSDEIVKPILGSDGKFHQVIKVVIDQRGGKTTVAGIHVQNLIDSPLITSAFMYNIEKRPMWTFLFPLAAGGIPVFILYSAWVSFRTVKRRRWLWVLFVLFGFGTISLDWSAGVISYKILSFNLLGAAFIKFGPYASWVFSIGVPLGAILFHVKKGKLQMPEDPLDPPEMIQEESAHPGTNGVRL